MKLNIDSLKSGGNLSKEYIEKAHKRAGGSNVGKKTFADGSKRTDPYAGPSGGAPKGSYPIGDIQHGRAALSLAHNAPNPNGIKAAVYRKYPSLKKKEGGYLGVAKKIEEVTGSDKINYGKSGIHINPTNKGKFTATKSKTGKSTEQLTHSKNPLTKKRAIFAQNAKHFHHEDGGNIVKPSDFITLKDGTTIESKGDTTVYTYPNGRKVVTPQTINKKVINETSKVIPNKVTVIKSTSKVLKSGGYLSRLQVGGVIPMGNYWGWNNQTNNYTEPYKQFINNAVNNPQTVNTWIKEANIPYINSKEDILKYALDSKRGDLHNFLANKYPTIQKPYYQQRDSMDYVQNGRIFTTNNIDFDNKTKSELNNLLKQNPKYNTPSGIKTLVHQIHNKYDVNYLETPSKLPGNYYDSAGNKIDKNEFDRLNNMKSGGTFKYLSRK